MSRVYFDHVDEDREVCLGLDKPTNSWFIQVWKYGCEQCGSDVDYMEKEHNYHGNQRMIMLETAEPLIKKESDAVKEYWSKVKQAVVLDLDPGDVPRSDDVPLTMSHELVDVIKEFMNSPTLDPKDGH